MVIILPQTKCVCACACACVCVCETLFMLSVRLSVRQSVCPKCSWFALNNFSLNDLISMKFILYMTINKTQFKFEKAVTVNINLDKGYGP